MPFVAEVVVLFLPGCKFQGHRASPQARNSTRVLGLKPNSLSHQPEPNLSGASLSRQRMKLWLTSGRGKLQPTASFFTTCQPWLLANCGRKDKELAGLASHGIVRWRGKRTQSLLPSPSPIWFSLFPRVQSRGQVLGAVPELLGFILTACEVLLSYFTDNESKDQRSSLMCPRSSILQVTKSILSHT